MGDGTMLHAMGLGYLPTCLCDAGGGECMGMGGRRRMVHACHEGGVYIYFGGDFVGLGGGLSLRILFHLDL